MGVQLINVIRVYNLYQYYQGCTTTIINISRGVQPFSILAGVYKVYKCWQGVQQHLAMLVGVHNVIIVIKGV